MKCPKCGHEFKAENQAKGGKARWRGVSKEERERAARVAALERWAIIKALEHYVTDGKPLPTNSNSKRKFKFGYKTG